MGTDHQGEPSHPGQSLVGSGKRRMFRLHVHNYSIVQEHTWILCGILVILWYFSSLACKFFGYRIAGYYFPNH